MTIGLRFLTLLLIAALSLVTQPSAAAQSHGSLRGSVSLKESGRALHGVSVLIVELGRSTLSGDDGGYEFNRVPPGRYQVMAHLDSLFTETTRIVTVEAGGAATADFLLELAPPRYEITVTGSAKQETTFESFQSVESMGPYDLAESTDVSLGELLDHKVGTGIAKRSFGPGASRPIVRGFDGDRVLVMEDSIRTGTLSSQSGDHGELINPAQLERLEIVKGPATLLYSGNAMGGTVNAVSRHHESHHHAHKGLRGFVSGSGGTNNAVGGSSAGLEYGIGKWMVWGRGGGIRAGDYTAPRQGKIYNSRSQMTNGGGGFGWYGKKTFFSLEVKYDNGSYGVPFAEEFHGHHGHGHDEEGEDEHEHDEEDEHDEEGEDEHEHDEEDEHDEEGEDEHEHDEEDEHDEEGEDEHEHDEEDEHDEEGEDEHEHDEEDEHDEEGEDEHEHDEEDEHDEEGEDEHEHDEEDEHDEEGEDEHEHDEEDEHDEEGEDEHEHDEEDEHDEEGEDEHEHDEEDEHDEEGEDEHEHDEEDEHDEEGEDEHEHDEEDEHGHEQEEIDRIRLDSRRWNYRFNWGLKDLGTVIDGFVLKLSSTHWSHDEIEIFTDGSSQVGTEFDQQEFVYRGTFEQGRIGALSGRFGFWGLDRDYTATGEEALSPPIDQTGFALFVLEEVDFETAKFQFGGRLETQRYRPGFAERGHEEHEEEGHDHGSEEGDEIADAVKRTFTGASASAGLHVNTWRGGALVVNYAHSYRAPSLEELYNFGPHAGTRAFEIGNPALLAETGDGIELSLRQNSERLRGELNLFYYNFDNFVFPFATGEVEDGLQVIDFTQRNARFLGTEANLDLNLNPKLWLNLGMDFVDAQDTDMNTPLPRIPPLRGKVGFDFNHLGFRIKPELILASQQDQTFTGETRTPGYGVVNLKASYTYAQQHLAHQFAVKVFNLSDRLYRNHSSFIKDLAPEIGRGVRLTYTVRFF